jgi:GDP-4-dehydro-6-deoxy-D-mannose reductase
MRVLVTGARGFVGKHLASHCTERGAEVTGVGRGPLAEAPFAYEQLDLLDGDATRALVGRLRPERVYHLAAEASVARSWETPAGVIEHNVSSTLHLLEAVRTEAPDAAVLVACSGEEYGPVPEEALPVREEQPLRPQNPYAASKAMSDLLAGFYADAHGVNVVRTRAFNHAGPGQSDTYVVASFARQIAEAEAASPEDGRAVIEHGNAEVRRDFSDVRDVVRAYWLALEQARPAGVLNVCSGRATSVSDILSRLAAHSTLEVQGRVDPARLREGEVMEIRGSHDKLTDATGWQPEIELDRTLLDTLEWWRQRVAAGVAR